METKILPVLNLTVLQEKANEYAMKGVIKEIEEYYSGYNSPFRKQIKEDLEAKSTSIHLELPDILALINESLNQEIDRIANNCIAETFMPLATKALTRIDKEIKFSDILEEFINSCHSEFKDNYRPEIEINEDHKYGWLSIKISFVDYLDKKIEYDFTLHTDKKEEKKYLLLALPTSKVPYDYNKKIKLANGEGSIEMPFTRDSLKDEFTSYLARIIICRSTIIMDCDDFDDSMFED